MRVPTRGTLLIKVAPSWKDDDDDIAIQHSIKSTVSNFKVDLSLSVRDNVGGGGRRVEHWAP